jgi:C-terminal processing protease CtpA/Prc
MFLLSEAKSGAKMTPLMKSLVPRQESWTKEEINALVDKIAKNANGKMYELNFAKSDSALAKTPLTIYRRGDDVIKRNMKPEDLKEYKKEIEAVLKGTGMKIIADWKSADWASFKIAPK